MTTSPAEILRNRMGAAGVNISLTNAEDCIVLMRAQGWKIVGRDLGETREVVLETKVRDGVETVVLCSDQPQILWAKCWEAMA